MKRIILAALVIMACVIQLRLAWDAADRSLARDHALMDKYQFTGTPAEFAHAFEEALHAAIAESKNDPRLDKTALKGVMHDLDDLRREKELRNWLIWGTAYFLLIWVGVMYRQWEKINKSETKQNY